MRFRTSDRLSLILLSCVSASILLLYAGPILGFMLVCCSILGAGKISSLSSTPFAVLRESSSAVCRKGPEGRPSKRSVAARSRGELRPTFRFAAKPCLNQPPSAYTSPSPFSRYANGAFFPNRFPSFVRTASKRPRPTSCTLSAKDKKGLTPLHAAAEQGQAATLEALLRRADAELVAAEDNDGRTALDFSRMRESEKHHP